MSHTFRVGDRVGSQYFRGIGEIVEGPDSHGRFRVAFGALAILLSADDLKAEPVSRVSKKRKATPLTIDRAPGTTKRTVSLDLHAKTVAQALELLEQALDRALLSGTSRIEVIHGLGTGAVRRAVHAALAASPHPSHFKLDDQNPGVTWVFLD